jgi:hypothetical protein
VLNLNVTPAQPASQSRSTVPTFEELCELEPRLLDLYREVSAVKDDGGPSFCANAVWDEWHPEWEHDSLKGRLFRLVGFAAESPDPILRSWQAERVAHDKIYDALPDCRNCACVALWETEIAPRLTECKR